MSRCKGFRDFSVFFVVFVGDFLFDFQYTNYASMKPPDSMERYHRFSAMLKHMQVYMDISGQETNKSTDKQND